MTIKQFMQTRWQITPQRVVLYPYGAVSIVAVMFGLAGTGWIMMMVHILQEPFLSFLAVLWPVVLFFFLLVSFFALFAGTKIIFDRERRVMFKLLLGFIKTTTLPFNEISGIQLLPSGRGNHRYYVLHKNFSSWDVSTVISSPVLNKDSPHARQFEADVLPIIQSFLHTRSKTGLPNYRKK